MTTASVLVGVASAVLLVAVLVIEGAVRPGYVPAFSGSRPGSPGVLGIHLVTRVR